MAKDGTNRGGARPGAGRPQKPLADKINEGNPGKRPLQVIEFKNMEDLKGKVVFMNFWATWCPPCIAEMPSIQKLYDKVKDDKDIVILTVEVEGKRDKVAKFMERKKLSLPVVYPNSSIPTEFFNGSLPTTIILDKKGNIAHTTTGMADYSGQDIVDFLNELKTMN